VGARAATRTVPGRRSLDGAAPLSSNSVELNELGGRWLNFSELCHMVAVTTSAAGCRGTRMR
jgi:hypothetical protein